MIYLLVKFDQSQAINLFSKLVRWRYLSSAREALCDYLSHRNDINRVETEHFEGCPLIYLLATDRHVQSSNFWWPTLDRHCVDMTTASWGLLCGWLQSQLSPVDGTGCSIQQPHPPLMSLSDIKDQHPSGREMALVLTAPLQKKTLFVRNVNWCRNLDCCLPCCRQGKSHQRQWRHCGVPRKPNFLKNYFTSHFYANGIFNYTNR